MSSRIHQTGFELNNLNLEMSGIQTDWGTVDISTASTKTGTYALRLVNAKGSAYYNFAELTHIRVSFFASLGLPKYNNQPPKIFCLRDASTNELLELKYERSTSTFQLYTSNTLRDTWIGYNPDIWYHFGIDYKRDSSGWADIWIDGVKRLNWDGDTGSTNPVQLFLGSYPGPESTDCYSPSTSYYDDFYMDDAGVESSSAPIASRFYFSNANGNGYYNGWMGSDADQIDNYLLVDEIPHDDETTYVLASGAGFIDSYDVIDYTLPANYVVDAVIPTVTAKKLSATDVKLILGTTVSGIGDSLGSSQDLTTAYALYWERFTTMSGGGIWDQNSIDVAECLIKSDGTYT